MDSAKTTRRAGSGRPPRRLDLYGRLVRPALFRTDPEWVHDRSVRAAEAVSRSGWLCRQADRYLEVDDPRLATAVGGVRMRSPLGLAAGYDKNAPPRACCPRWGSATSRSARCRRIPRPATLGRGC